MGWNNPSLALNQLWCHTSLISTTPRLFVQKFDHTKLWCMYYWPFEWGIHWSPVDSLHKGPVMRNMTSSPTASSGPELGFHILHRPSSCARNGGMETCTGRRLGRATNSTGWYQIPGLIHWQQNGCCLANDILKCIFTEKFCKLSRNMISVKCIPTGLVLKLSSHQLWNCCETKLCTPHYVCLVSSKGMINTQTSIVGVFSTLYGFTVCAVSSKGLK